MAILNELDVPCGPIMSTEDLANDEHVRGRDMYVELDHPQRGKWYNVGMPIKLSASPAKIERSPTLGEHTDEILKEVLGLSDARYRRRSKQAGAFSLPPKKSRDEMKIAIIGQQDFGKAVLEAFLARGDEVAAVFCAPEKEGARPDALARRRAGEGSASPSVQIAARSRSLAGHASRRAPISASWLSCCSSRRRNS